MRTILILLVFSCVTILPGCGNKAAGPAENVSNVSASGQSGSARSVDDPPKRVEPSSATAGAAEPKTIREFFMLLPEKYFVLEGCNRESDNDCQRAKRDYLKTFTEVEDTANGYLKGGCDGAQACLEMTIFKRPDATYLVAVATEAEMMTDQYFLDYKNGQWTDVSADVVPEFSKKNLYELPRKGTTVKVYSKKIIEKGDDYEAAEKGSRLYDLEWKDGKFSIKN